MTILSHRETAVGVEAVTATFAIKRHSHGFARNFLIRSALAFLLLFLSCFSAPSLAATNTVCASGCDHQTIQAAIDAASSGDTIEVYTGTYAEQVDVNKSVNLQNLNSTPPLMQGGFNVTANYVNITGFNITSGYNTSTGTGGRDRYGIWLNGANHTNVTSNSIYGLTGVTGFGGANTGGSAYGVYVSSSANNTVASNNISGLTGGSGGTSGGSGYPGGLASGIYMSSSANNTVSLNNVTSLIAGAGGNAGGGVGGTGGQGGSSSGVSLSSSSANNTIVSNTISGLTGGAGGNNDGGTGGTGGYAYGFTISSSTGNSLTSNVMWGLAGGNGGGGPGTPGAAGTSYGAYLTSSTANSFVGGSIAAPGYDYYLQSAGSINTFAQTNFTADASRRIYFADTSSHFNYNNQTAGNIWLKTGVSSAGNLTRMLASWSNTRVKWNDTNTTANFNANYTLTGLLPNVNYRSTNSSRTGSNFRDLVTDSNGNLPSFTIKLNGNTEIKVVRFNRVCPSGCDYPTIQQAIDAATEGDYIMVEPGTYAEQVDVNKSVNLQNLNSTLPLMQGGFNVTANYVNITGFNITSGYNTSTGTGGLDRYGIWLNGASYTNVVSNVIWNLNGAAGTTGGTAVGIYLSASCNSTLSGNTVTNATGGSGISVAGTSSGIYLNSSSNGNSLADNVITIFTGTIGYGVCIQSSFSNNITGGSIVSQSGHDYYLQNASDTNLFRNTNFTAQRAIYFADKSSYFNYNNQSAGNIWLATNISSANSYLNRSLSNWTSADIRWNDTNSTPAPTVNYTLTGLLPSVSYRIVNSSLGGSSFRVLATDANGNLPSFTIKLNGNTEINLTLPGPVTVCAAGCDFATIQAAIDAAPIGGIIKIYPGTYAEQVDVNKSVNLQNLNSTLPLMQGGFNVTANYVNITGFNITSGYNTSTGTGGLDRYGIWLNGANHTNVTSNTIYDLMGASGGSPFGIYISSSSANNTIASNNMTNFTAGAGGSSAAIYIADPSSYNNTITATTTFGGYSIPDTTKLNTIDGAPILYFYNRSNINITGFNVTTTTGTAPINVQGNSTGIALIQVANSIIRNSTIIAGGDSQFGVYLSSSSNANAFANNTVLLSGANAHGFYIASSTRNTITGGSIIATGGGYDYYLQNAGSNNTFRSTDFTDQRKIYFADTSSYFVYNDNSTTGNVWLATNVSAQSYLNRTLSNWNSTLVKWNDTNSTPGMTANYTLTGLPARAAFYVYRATPAAGRTFMYDLFTDQTGILPSFTVALDGDTEIELMYNITLLSVRLLLPQNITYAATSLPLNYSISAGTPDAAWYLYNGTNVTFSGNTTFIALDNQQSTLYLYVNDTSGHVNVTNVTFTVDTTPPGMTIQSPANQTYVTSSTWFNLTLSEPASRAGYSLDGMPNVTLTNSSGNWNGFNSSMSDGVHTAVFYANDTVGNMNATNTTFAVDTLPPFLRILLPQNMTYVTTTSPLNYTVSDPNLEAVWYLYNGTNVTFSGNTTFTALDDQQSTLWLYANDTVGHVNVTSITFTVYTGWWNVSFDYRVPLDIISPVAVNYRPIWANVSTNGHISNCTREIRVTAISAIHNDETEIPSWLTPNGDGAPNYCSVFFHANLTAGTQTFYVYYGNSVVETPNYPQYSGLWFANLTTSGNVTFLSDDYSLNFGSLINNEELNGTNFTITNSSQYLNFTNYFYFDHDDAFNMTNGSFGLYLPVGASYSVHYNATDGTWRPVTELGGIGQGSWSTSTSTLTNFFNLLTVNYTLAAGDGYDYGIRDLAAGGSYWLDENGLFLDAGLVGEWHLEEGPGANYANDSSGYGNHGTLWNMDTTGNNATSGWNSTDCLFGTCLKFDGTDDAVNVSSPAGFPTGANPRTLEVWLKPDDIATDYMPIIAYGSQSTGKYCALEINNSRAHFSSWWNDLTGTTILAVGHWYHIVGTYDGANMSIYVNGVFEGTNTTTLNTTIDAGFGFKMGTKAACAGCYLNGTLDEVRLYNRSLSATEVRQRYAQSRMRLGNDFLATKSDFDIVNITDPSGSSKLFTQFLPSQRLNDVPLRTVYRANESSTYFYSWADQDWVMWQKNSDNALAGYWKFDSVDGQDYTPDSSGNGNDGLLRNFANYSQSFTAGKIGNGLQFDGVNDAVLVGSVTRHVNVTDTAKLKVRSISVSGSTSNLTNHQVRVAVNYDSDMRSDYRDIRFVDANLTALSHWLGSSNASQAIFWVKVPSIPTSGTTIYMHFGNPSASSASDGAATFEFFDDFSDNDISDWTTSGGGSVTADSYSIKLYVAIQCYDLEAYRDIGNYSTSLLFSYDWQTYYSQYSYVEGGWKALENGTAKIDEALPMVRDGSNSGTKEANAAITGTARLLFRMYDLPECQYTGAGVNTLWIDNIRVRKHASPEPVATVGGDQTVAQLSGVYLSDAATVSEYPVISITPIWNQTHPNLNFTMAVSANGGASWCSNVSNGTKYTSCGGIGTGNQLRYGLNFSATNETNLTDVGYNVSFVYVVDWLSRTSVPGLNNITGGITVEAWVSGVNAANFSGNKTRTTSAFDKFNPQFQVVGDKIYYLWSEYDGSYYQLWTADMGTDGTEWNVTKRTTSSVSKSTPQLQVVGDKIYYVWVENSQIWTAEMNVNGTSWNATQRTSSDAHKNPQLQVVGSRIYFVWYNDNAGSRQILTARMNLNGTGWSATGNSISQSTGKDTAPQFQVVGNDIHYVWHAYPGGNWRIYTAKTDLNGAGWSGTARTSSNNGYYPQLQVVGDKIYYAYLITTSATLPSSGSAVTAVMNTDGTGWSATTRTTMPATAASSVQSVPPVQLQVVGDKIYYVSIYTGGFGDNKFITAEMNTDGTGFVAVSRPITSGSSFTRYSPQLQVVGARIYYVWSSQAGRSTRQIETAATGSNVINKGDLYGIGIVSNTTGVTMAQGFIGAGLDRLKFMAEAGSQTAGKTVNSTIGPNLWTHIAMTYDNSTIKLYVNGTLMSASSFPGALPSENQLNLVIGDNITGTLDEIKVYARALTSTEIKAEYDTARRGMPDWNDPRYKQEFKWQQRFDRSGGYPSLNITYLMTAHDPFVRVLFDSANTTTAGPYNLTFKVSPRASTYANLKVTGTYTEYTLPVSFSSAGSADKSVYFYERPSTMENQTVLFSASNWQPSSDSPLRNVTLSASNLSLSGKYDLLTYNYSLSSANAFLLALGYTGPVNTSVGAGNWTLGFSSEPLERVVNSTLTYYDILGWNTTAGGNHTAGLTFRYNSTYTDDFGAGWLNYTGVEDSSQYAAGTYVDNRTIGGRQHRILDMGQSSLSFNLADHDEKEQQEYDQRKLAVRVSVQDPPTMQYQAGEAEPYPPSPTILLPQNTTYYDTTTRSLNYAVSDLNLDTVWYFYNGQNVTLTGNTTFTALDDQQSALWLYANDTAGNVNVTNVTFTVETAGVTPTPTATAAAAGGGGGGGGFLIPAETPAAGTIVIALTPPIPDPLINVSATLTDLAIAGDEIRATRVFQPERTVPAPPGIIYAYVEITRNFDISRIVGARIDFRVNKTWMDSNDIDLPTMALYKYEDGVWKKPPQLMTGEDKMSHLFSANTTSFPLLAITGFRKAAAGGATPSPIPTATPTPAKTELPSPVVVLPTTPEAVTEPSVILPVLALIVIVAALYYYRVWQARKCRVVIEGIVVRHTKEGFEMAYVTEFVIIDYVTEFVIIDFGGKKPPVASRVRVEGTRGMTLTGKKRISAASVRQLEDPFRGSENEG